MNKVKVVEVNSEGLKFDNGVSLYSDHQSDCCEYHYLSFENITLEDFKDLEFDLTSDTLLEKVKDYGIALHPIVGFPIRIPGYGYNNGYCSSQLAVVLEGEGLHKVIDITECQVIEG